MKNKKKYFGLSLMIAGIGLFIYYYMTGKVFFLSYDEVSQVEEAKITSYADYMLAFKHEAVLLILSLLFFLSGVIILLGLKARNKMLKE